MSVLAGGVFSSAAADDDVAELRGLVVDIGSQSFDARLGRRGLPEEFDDTTWRHLEDTGLSRLTTTADLGAGPTEAAVVLRGLARYAVAAPVAETDLLAAWLARAAGADVPETGALTVAIGDGALSDGRLTGSAADVPWTRGAGAVVIAVPTDRDLLVTVTAPNELEISDGHNLGGEPRDGIRFDVPEPDVVRADRALLDELNRRGAWARCVQIIGALDAAAELSVAHTRERAQFGRPLSKFQAVQHALAGMAGDIERARAATTFAVAAAADHGFDDPRTDYAVALAKVVAGQVVPAVTTVAHQLHGAIGVTIEHQLWSATNRAHSWVTEFGSTGHHARRLGRLALAGHDDAMWDVLTGPGIG